MTEIEIGGRKVPLSYTAYEMIEIQKQIGCTAFQVKDTVFGLRLENEDDPKSLQLDVAKDPERLEKLGALIAILGNQMEAKREESGPVDEGLEEEQAKKQPGN